MRRSFHFGGVSGPALTAGAALCALAAGAAEFHGQPYEGGDLYADTWVATDGAGRVLPGFKECGPVKPDKWVGIFYWTWHTPNRGGPNDNTRLIAAAKGGPVAWPANGAPHHWGEPETRVLPDDGPFRDSQTRQPAGRGRD